MHAALRRHLQLHFPLFYVTSSQRPVYKSTSSALYARHRPAADVSTAWCHRSPRPVGSVDSPPLSASGLSRKLCVVVYERRTTPPYERYADKGDGAVNQPTFSVREALHARASAYGGNPSTDVLVCRQSTAATHRDIDTLLPFWD